MIADAPEHLDLASADIAAERRQELLALFPEVRTEGYKIDFDRLRLALGEAVDVGRERYGLTWPGKAECFQTIQAPSVGTLRPVRTDSVDFDTAENLIIEGDNLEVLKLLQKSYLRSVKLIYIDPPYNTGREFVYPDDYSESLQTYLQYTGQVDAEGRRFSTNAETEGRFHSKWLSMMYPRLYLARNLLRDDGVIFISIGEQEVDNLRKICHEIFGEENFIATVIWQKVYSPKNSAKHFSEDHDYILVYARSADVWRPTLLPRTEEMEARYKNPDNDPRGPWKPGGLDARNYYSRGTYPIQCPGGRVIDGPPAGSYWRISEAKFKALDADNRIWWGEDGNNVPQIKRFLSEVIAGKVPQTIWTYSDVGHTQDAKKELIAAVPFETSDNVIDSLKPTRLIKRMLQLATDPTEGDLVLDFFAGTGTTGDAVLRQNQEDGGNRRFILIQLPEPLDRPETQLRTIADVCRARVRSIGQTLAAEQARKLDLNSVQVDLGFRALSLAESNFTPWRADVNRDAESLIEQLEMHVDHIRDGRTTEDLLFEILLKSGLPLTTPVETVDLAGRMGYSVDSGKLLICLDRELTLETIRAMAERQPERVVCLDTGFAGNDQLKANAVLTFRSKGVASFKTV